MKNTSAAILKLHCLSCTENMIKMAALCTQDQPFSDNSAVVKTFIQQSTSLCHTNGTGRGGPEKWVFRQKMVNAWMQHCSYSEHHWQREQKINQNPLDIKRGSLARPAVRICITYFKSSRTPGSLESTSHIHSHR